MSKSECKSLFVFDTMPMQTQDNIWTIKANPIAIVSAEPLADRMVGLEVE